MFQFKTISICGTIANFYELPSLTQKEEGQLHKVSLKSTSKSLLLETFHSGVFYQFINQDCSSNGKTKIIINNDS